MISFVGIRDNFLLNGKVTVFIINIALRLAAQVRACFETNDLNGGKYILRHPQPGKFKG
jgi:hypothetical protein